MVVRIGDHAHRELVHDRHNRGRINRARDGDSRPEESACGERTERAEPGAQQPATTRASEIGRIGTDITHRATSGTETDLDDASGAALGTSILHRSEPGRLAA
ncbi:MAG: hypothetical protein RML56_15820 [Burkholderiales bacterium]|nr:hypothetical protein [Burkholderiales bacterium]